MKVHHTNDYLNIVINLIRGNHPYSNKIKLDDNDKPIIGYGFDLYNPWVLLTVFKVLGFDTNREVLKGQALAAEFNYMQSIRNILLMVDKMGLDIANSNIEAVMLERYHNNCYREFPFLVRRKSFEFEDAKESKSILVYLKKYYEQQLDCWLISNNENVVGQHPALFTQDSKERIALLSLVMRGAIKINKTTENTLSNLHNALLESNRAEAWFIIRYQTNLKDTQDVVGVKRAYFESELFGLYDYNSFRGDNFREQSKAIYSIYNEYRQEIIAYEKKYAPYIKHANVEFGLQGGERIKTIEQSFQLAYDAIRKTQGLQELSPIEKMSHTITHVA